MRERGTGGLCSEPLSRAELGAAPKALATSGLPADDVDADDVKLFAFKLGGRTVGYGGLEIHGDAALLRSIRVILACGARASASGSWRNLSPAPPPNGRVRRSF